MSLFIVNMRRVNCLELVVGELDKTCSIHCNYNRDRDRDKPCCCIRIDDCYHVNSVLYSSSQLLCI